MNHLNSRSRTKRPLENNLNSRRDELHQQIMHLYSHLDETLAEIDKLEAEIKKINQLQRKRPMIDANLEYHEEKFMKEKVRETLREFLEKEMVLQELENEERNKMLRGEREIQNEIERKERQKKIERQQTQHVLNWLKKTKKSTPPQKHPLQSGPQTGFATGVPGSALGTSLAPGTGLASGIGLGSLTGLGPGLTSLRPGGLLTSYGKSFPQIPNTPSTPKHKKARTNTPPSTGPRINWHDPTFNRLVYDIPYNAAGAINANRGAINPNRGAINPNRGSINANRGAINANRGAINVNRGAINANEGVVGANEGVVGANEGAVLSGNLPTQPSTPRRGGKKRTKKTSKKKRV